MLIEIASRLDPGRPYLSASLNGNSCYGYEVNNLTSPIEKVRKYYDNILAGNFDYSFVSARGQHLFYGTTEHQARNLLLALAQESARCGREPKFSPTSEALRYWFAGSELSLSLLKSHERTISMLAGIIGADKEGISDFAAWLYYCVQAALVSGTTDTQTVGKLILAIIKNETEFSSRLLTALDQLDPTFLALWAHEGSYQALRHRAIAHPDTLRLLGSFSPQSDVRARRPSRSADKLHIAARGATRSSMIENPAIWQVIEKELANVVASPAPLYLPPLGNPQKVAYNVLKYFQHNLPSLEEVARVLGTQIIQADLPQEILGLYVANTEAHHSVILVNRNSRNEGAQRFTICHELGHYLLHSDSAFLCGYKEIYEHTQATEAEANTFAAELLMPISLMREMLSRKFNSSTVVEVATRFNCSIEAATRRFVDLADQRKLALVVVIDRNVNSIAGTKINANGLRWIGKQSAGTTAVSLANASMLTNGEERRLSKFLPDAQADWLQDLEISLYPFQSGDGYYLFLELSA